jgi:hypothetical protein
MCHCPQIYDRFQMASAAAGAGAVFFAADFLATTFFPAAFFGAAFFAAAGFDLAASAFFAAHRFFKAATIAALPALLSLRFGFNVAGAGGSDSPRILAHRRC